MATKKKVEVEATEAAVDVKDEAVDVMSDDYWDELVEIELFKDTGKYSGDKFVSVNNEQILIQRGVPVKIKRKFYEVLKNSMEQEKKTAAEIARLTK